MAMRGFRKIDAWTLLGSLRAGIFVTALGADAEPPARTIGVRARRAGG